MATSAAQHSGWTFGKQLAQSKMVSLHCNSDCSKNLALHFRSRHCTRKIKVVRAPQHTHCITPLLLVFFFWTCSFNSATGAFLEHRTIFIVVKQARNIFAHIALAHPLAFHISFWRFDTIYTSLHLIQEKRFRLIIFHVAQLHDGLTHWSTILAGRCSWSISRVLWRTCTLFHLY